MPVGLFGLAIRIGARIGRDRVEQLFEREIQVGLRIVDFANLRAGHFGVEAVHGVGRAEEQHFLAVVDVGVDEDLDGFVGAVGEERTASGRRGSSAAMASLGFAVFGVDGEAARRRAASLSDSMTLRRAADGVLVEIEAQFAGAVRRWAASRAPSRATAGRGRIAPLGSLAGHAAHLHGAGVGFQAFGARERGDRGRQRRKRRRD